MDFLALSGLETVAAFELQLQTAVLERASIFLYLLVISLRFPHPYGSISALAVTPGSCLDDLLIC